MARMFEIGMQKFDFSFSYIFASNRRAMKKHWLQKKGMKAGDGG